jgi:hypothetical protein
MTIKKTPRTVIRGREPRIDFPAPPFEQRLLYAQPPLEPPRRPGYSLAFPPQPKKAGGWPSLFI